MKMEFDSMTQFRLLDAARFELDGKDYLIIKYLYDDKNADDEEMLYFYSPDFGTLIFRSAWWVNYDRRPSLDFSDGKVNRMDSYREAYVGVNKAALTPPLLCACRFFTNKRSHAKTYTRHALNTTNGFLHGL